MLAASPAALFRTVVDGTIFRGPVPALFQFTLWMGVQLFFLRFGFLALVVALACRGLWGPTR